MDKLFSNILIPVDFSVNTEIAVRKANGLIDKKGVIHLAHVFYRPAYLPFLGMEPFFQDTTESFWNAEHFIADKLNQWKNAIIDNIPEVVVFVHLLKGKNVQQQIIELSKKLEPQIIIIGKNNYHNWFGFLNTINPDTLAKNTHCPVLTVKMGSFHNRIKSIVFPVQTAQNDRKIDLLVTLAKRYRARVHLVMLSTGATKKDPFEQQHFVNTYRTLKASLNAPIQYTFITGHNINRSALHYAKDIQADLVMLNPDADTGLFNIRLNQVTDFIKADSKLEVLSMEP